MAKKKPNILSVGIQAGTVAPTYRSVFIKPKKEYCSIKSVASIRSRHESQSVTPVPSVNQRKLFGCWESFHLHPLLFVCCLYLHSVVCLYFNHVSLLLLSLRDSHKPHSCLFTASTWADGWMLLIISCAVYVVKKWHGATSSSVLCH